MKKLTVWMMTLLMLSGCAVSEHPDGYEQIAEGKYFADQLPEEDLRRPERVIDSAEDFRTILDWMAFYRISDTVWFDVDKAYAEELFNPYTAFQKAYTSADLADVYAAHIDDTYYSDYRIVGISYSMSRDIASAPPEEITDTPVVPSFDYRKDGDYIYREDPEKRAVRCENGEQLYYLLMNGYTPVPEKGSTAEKLYAEAQSILHQIIRNDMSDFEKIKAVYDWLTTEVVYDSQTAYSSDTYLVKEQAYYAEGVFLNRCAVCDGKAKAYAILLNMLGIPCYRTTGVSEAGDHAWNMVQLDGKWYISCATYGQKNAEKTLGRILPDYSILLADRDTAYGDEWGYTAQKHADIASLLEKEPYDVYGAMSEDGISRKAEDTADVRKLLEYAEQTSEREYKAEFVYTGDEPDNFENELIAYLETLKNVQAVPVRCKDGRAYAVICMKEEK